MMSAIQRIARGVFFAREAAAAPERSQFDYDSFEHVEGLHLPADQCWRSSSLDFDDTPGDCRPSAAASMPVTQENARRAPAGNPGAARN